MVTGWKLSTLSAADDALLGLLRRPLLALERLDVQGERVGKALRVNADFKRSVASGTILDGNLESRVSVDLLIVLCLCQWLECLGSCGPSGSTEQHDSGGVKTLRYVDGDFVWHPKNILGRA